MEEAKAEHSELDPSCTAGQHQSASAEPAAPDEKPHLSIAFDYQDPADMLRKLSLIDAKRPSIHDLDPHISQSTLGLSGGIISAAICIPYSLGIRANGEWEVSTRKGTSALFDSFASLSNFQTDWHHTLVGWTGEIRKIQESRFRPGNPVNPVAYNPPQRSTASQAGSPTILKPNLAPDAPTAHQPSAPFHPTGPPVISAADRARLDERMSDTVDGRIAPVWLYDKEQEGRDQITFTDQARWRRYAEHYLYTLFHYKQHDPTDGRAEFKQWQDYQRLNEKFADRIMSVYQPGDIVWIHDYHLLLLPQLLRQRKPDIYIAFFLHIPFPSSEFLKCLSRRSEILTGVLGSNMIGFQTYNYLRHFSSCCRRILGFETENGGIDAYGARAAIDVFPIGIDAPEVAKQAYGDDLVVQKMKKIREQFPGMKIIIGRDRLDTVRGVAQKLQAFELFLERYPEWIGKVVLVQVTSPTSVEEEKEDAGHKIAGKISELVRKINGLYGGLEYRPVWHFPQYLAKDEYFALLRVAHVGLITSVRDGMNTTSLEYVLCQHENHGPLILSEFSGTASSLTQAIHINPWNLGNVADNINYALTMSEAEKDEQHRLLYTHIKKHDVHEWSKNFLSRLITNLESCTKAASTPLLDQQQLANRYRRAHRRLFMFDYDGTLTPIVKDPRAATPSDRVVRTIKTLAKNKRNNVWIISGRDQKFLEEWLGHISELGLSAEHGSFIRYPGCEGWENLAETTEMSWQDEVVAIFDYYTERTKGAEVERKTIAVTWHYRLADPEYGKFQAGECKKYLESTVVKKWDIEVMSGKANLEVRPRLVNKGAIATRLISEYGTQQGAPPDFVLCLGDDHTDEDMFKALKDSTLPPDDAFAVTIGASSKQTQATWHLLEPPDVIASIAGLNSTDLEESA